MRSKTGINIGFFGRPFKLPDRDLQRCLCRELSDKEADLRSKRGLWGLARASTLFPESVSAYSGECARLEAEIAELRRRMEEASRLVML